MKIDIQSKTFGTQSILEQLTFECLPNTFTAIIAPSGAGKTTLLNLIAGLDQDYQGSIDFSATQAQHERDLAFMFQSANLMPWLNVQDNIELVIPKAQRSPEILQRIPELLARVGLTGCEQSFPSQLSGGMLRRVALVRAFVLRPNLLLMDEPFQSLDAPTAEQLRELLLELWRDSGASVLLVTHDLREALALADRILFLSAKPARIILDYAVLLDRPRQLESAAVNGLHHELLQQYPYLLQGSLEQ